MLIKFETPRLVLRNLSENEASALLVYFSRNRNFLEPWESLREPLFYTKNFMQQWIQKDNEQIEKGTTLRLWLFKKDSPQHILGSVALGNIVRGPLQSAFLGYRLDKEVVNLGYMTEAVGKMVAIGFDQLALHRIEANVMPKNLASIRTLEKNGFSKEGFSPKYLRINGIWEDHFRFAIINESGKNAIEELENTFL